MDSFDRQIQELRKKEAEIILARVKNKILNEKIQIQRDSDKNEIISALNPIIDHLIYINHHYTICRNIIHNIQIMYSDDPDEYINTEELFLSIKINEQGDNLEISEYIKKITRDMELICKIKNKHYNRNRGRRDGYNYNTNYEKFYVLHGKMRESNANDLIKFKKKIL